LPQITDRECSLSPAELDASIRRTLRGANWARLHSYGRRLIRLYRLAPVYASDDLFQEAIRRVYANSPSADLDMLVILMGAMKSIASNWFRQTATRQTEPADDFEDPEHSAEYQLLGKRRYQEIFDSLRDDPVAQSILDGIIEGYEGKDLERRCDVDATGLASKRKKIGRHIKGLKS
jgi:hypothetical protein